MIYKINSIIWGAPLLILLLGTGLLISIRIKFFQIKKFGYILKNTFFTLFKSKSSTESKDKDSISQFKAVSTALAAAMGTGNIVGVATALTIGAVSDTHLRAHET